MDRKQITERYENIDKYVFDAIAKDILKKIKESGKEKNTEAAYIKTLIKEDEIDIIDLIELALSKRFIKSADKKAYNKLSDEMFNEAENQYLTMIARDRIDNFDPTEVQDSDARSNFIELLGEITKGDDALSLSEIPVEIKIGKKGMKLNVSSKFNGLYLAYILGIIGDDDRMEE